MQYVNVRSNSIEIMLVGFNVNIECNMLTKFSECWGNCDTF